MLATAAAAAAVDAKQWFSGASLKAANCSEVQSTEYVSAGAVSPSPLPRPTAVYTHGMAGTSSAGRACSQATRWSNVSKQQVSAALTRATTEPPSQLPSSGREASDSRNLTPRIQTQGGQGVFRLDFHSSTSRGLERATEHSMCTQLKNYNSRMYAFFL